MNDDKKPEIRFKEFTDTWEQRKLSDFGKSTGGTSIESEFEDSGKYKVISIGSYSENSKYNDQGLRCKLSDKTKIRILNQGDLTMILNDKTAQGRIIGRALLIDKSDEYVYNQRTERIETDTEKYDSHFIYQLLNAPNMREKIIKQSQGNTQIFVNWTAIQNTEYLVPSKKEQKQIGEYFDQLDNLITLHQRKYDKLVNIKKAMLDKMFPKNGKNVPEIRFRGFTDAWEQRKLKDFTKYTSSNLTAESIDKNGKYDLYDANTVIGKTNSNIQKEKYITIIKDGSGVGRTRLLPSNSSFIGTMGAIKENNSDINFIYCCLQNTDFSKEINGATIPHIYYSNYGENQYYIPKVEEQQKIGAYFERIDNLITLHQRKLEKLKQIKKSLLDKMFI